VDQITRTKINELRNEVDQEWAFSMRKEYLSECMADLVVDWWVERDSLADYISRFRMLETILTQEHMAAIIKQITRYQNEIWYRRKAMEGKSLGVSNDEIQQARSHPWTDVMEFVGGMALCPFHDDHHPSFSVKKGYGKCWSCGWRGDIIQFWMQKNGRTFAEAVRSLL
jgi:hypothetical protein